MHPLNPSPRPRSPYLAPLIALSSLLFILVATIGVVGAVKLTADGGGGDPPGGRTPTPGSRNPSAGSSSLIDPCVVGTWRVTSHTEKVAIDTFGTVTFTGHGAMVILREDGTGETDYGDGTEFTGTASGQTIGLELRGTVRFRYATANGTVSFRDLTADGTAIVSLNGDEVGRTPLEGSSDPASYTCDEDSLVESTDLYRVEMEPA